MIYYDKVTFHVLGVDGFGDPVPGEEFSFDVPAELWPISSTETDKSPLTGTGTPKTVYRVATPFDVSTRGSLVPPGWTAQGRRWSIIYRGKTLDTPAGFERHAVSGRLDHYEFVAEDFLSTI